MTHKKILSLPTRGQGLKVYLSSTLSFVYTKNLGTTLAPRESRSPPYISFPLHTFIED